MYQITDDIGPTPAPELRPPQVLENGACDSDVAYGAHTCHEGHKLAA